MEKFISIKENVQTEIVVKKSKFICNLIRVENQREAEECIKKIKKKKTYYFRIRGYNILNGKKIYGKWSKSKKIKISK